MEVLWCFTAVGSVLAVFVGEFFRTVVFTANQVTRTFLVVVTVALAHPTRGSFGAACP